jgi:hypothetical protein
MHIHPAKLPVSSISEVMNDGKLNEPTQEAINELLKGFLLG